MLAEQVLQRILELPQIAIIGGLGIGLLISVVGIIAHYWYKAQQVRSENELKRTLVEQGLSADEIERIIAAKGKEPPDPD